MAQSEKSLYAFDEDALRRLKIDKKMLKQLVSEGAVSVFREGDTVADPSSTEITFAEEQPEGTQTDVTTSTMRADCVLNAEEAAVLRTLLQQPRLSPPQLAASLLLLPSKAKTIIGGLIDGHLVARIEKDRERLELTKEGRAAAELLTKPLRSQRNARVVVAP